MLVKIDFLFSKNNKIGSKLISWGTSHMSEELYDMGFDPSHVAILVNKRWVHESTLESGVRVIPYKEWLKINYQLKVIPYSEIEYSIVKRHFKNLKEKKYDWVGVVYLGFWVLAKKLFNSIKVPENNPVEDPSKYFCCEVVGELVDINLDMKTPIEVLELLVNKN